MQSNYFKMSSDAAFAQSLILVFISGSLVSPVADLLGNVAIEKLLNIIVVMCLLLSLFFISLHDGVRIIRPNNCTKIVLLLVAWMSALSIFKNSVVEMLPTLLRYSMYLLLFDRFYKIAKKDFMSGKKTLENLLLIALVIGIVFGVIRMVQGDLKFVNDAYRLAGNFGEHYLGYALFLYIPLVYFGCTLIHKFNFRLFILLLLGLFCFFMAQSRSLQVLLLGSYFCFSFFYKPGLRRKFLIMGLVALFSCVFIVFLLKTDIPVFTRLKVLFLAEQLDASTLYRVHILTSIIEAYNSSRLWLGVGLGGFNSFFFRLTGESDVAAHNDYLLFFTEGGWSALAGYILFQILILVEIFKTLINAQSRQIASIALGLFITVKILGFMLNSYYFYLSEIMLIAILALAISPKAKVTRLDYGLNN